MTSFAGPGGGIRPGTRSAFDAPPEHRQGHPVGYSPRTQFSLRDLEACYPMPAWVAERIRNFPQVPEGNALRDPLPVPFTDDEVRQALLDVWLASHQRNLRRCATVPAASVQIALQVLPILRSRNGGWIDFSGRAYDPLVNTPGSNMGRGVDLRCLLVKLAGKPIPPALGCNAAPPHPSRTYSILDVATTFDPSEAADTAYSPGYAPWTGAPPLGQPHRPWTGSDLEANGLRVPASPPGLPQFRLIASFGAHE